MNTYARVIGLPCPLYACSAARKRLWEMTACLSGHNLPTALWLTCLKAARDSRFYDDELCDAITATLRKLAQHDIEGAAALAQLASPPHPWFTCLLNDLDQCFGSPSSTTLSPPPPPFPARVGHLLDGEVWVDVRGGELFGVWPEPRFAGNLAELAVLREFEGKGGEEVMLI